MVTADDRHVRPVWYLRLLSAVAIVATSLVTLGALFAATYDHEGGTPFASAWVQWGQLLLAAGALGLAIASTEARLPERRALIAATSLALAAAWPGVLILGIE